MSNQTSARIDPSANVEWTWLSDSDPSLASQSIKWSRYSDVENRIIEDAFKAGLPIATLDEIYIDFENNIQVSNNDINDQRPIQRQVRHRMNTHLREERFMISPIPAKNPFSGLRGWTSNFIMHTKKELKLKKEESPSHNPRIIPMLVEKAAQGIIEEGKNIGKTREAEWMANQLMQEKNNGVKEVWRCCARLYTMESFLYKKINETMRLVGSKEHENVWRSKTRTFGPFCLLLWDDPYNHLPLTGGKMLYRGANLSDDLIAQYTKLSRSSDQRGSFQAFTSSSRSRAKAEQFGNVLFVMQVNYAYTTDLSPLSEYPDEEEELIHPGVCFTINGTRYDPSKNKHEIYLTLTHNVDDDHANPAVRLYNGVCRASSAVLLPIMDAFNAARPGPSAGGDHRLSRMTNGGYYRDRNGTLCEDPTGTLADDCYHRACNQPRYDLD
ncbi:unnamed protein product [Rotaria sp. Silwood1]|nr:unnamed protein product [Rotaria sp. Silwood1]CAF1654909.1 unnamed protein product [Rotaria sp. Silwood1]CAF3875048.1 unnamed protein product [Rotaria sp. Silwood1]CAF3880738.1 unnamed protein product [Rotaria sp. Silwood1]CAF4912123.1 unnamed protein product [Rotaria sp. Silwood1]